ncbi:hypothetical protein [Arsenophonus nasoniae]|uniref:hypothetical protein n=1 Tax=Arsenophonus nasoniae TaxID=638 RepID=UPI003879AD1B
MIIKFFRTIFPVILIITSAKISQAATPTMFWDIKSVKPLKEITFGITINAAAAIDEFYFANQFDFTHGGGIGYIGIQPTKNNKDNIRQFKVIFSSFRHDSSTQHKNCKQGADGMKTGVSCKIYIPGNLKDTFLFKVKKDGEILTGSVLNKSTGRVDVIGQWKIANSEGFLATSQVSWIEKLSYESSKLYACL